jgi:hypothetical protein
VSLEPAQNTGGSAAEGGPEATYSAFISYSHADEARAAWLQRRLETYQVPGSLVGRPRTAGPIPRRLKRVFRDAAELSVGDLTQEIRAALSRSEALIVICSPDAAKSRWVNQEIALFKSLRPGAPILPAIVGGEPHAAGKPGFGADDECFPAALLSRVGSDGSAIPDAELIAADFRPGLDGDETGFLRLAAGLLGVGLDDLIQREKQAERRRRLMWASIAAGAGALALVASVTAGVALWQQRRAHEALVRLLPDRSRDIFNQELALDTTQHKGLARAARFALAGLALSPQQKGPFRTLLGRLIMADASLSTSAMRVSCLGGSRPGPPVGVGTAAESPLVAPGFALDAAGDRLVLACPDQSVHLWDVDHGRDLASVRPGGRVLAATFAPDDSSILIARAGQPTVSWDPANAQVRPAAASGAAPAVVAVRGDAQGLAILSDDTPAPVAPAGLVLLGNDATASAAAVSKAGDVALAQGASPASVTVRPAKGGADPVVLRDLLSQGVTSLAFSPDSTRLVSTDREGRIRIWDVGEGAVIFQAPSGGARPLGASFSGDGHRLVVSEDGQAVVWDIRPLTEKLPRLVAETCHSVLRTPASHVFLKAERARDPLILELWSEEGLAKNTDLCAAATVAAKPSRKS